MFLLKWFRNSPFLKIKINNNKNKLAYNGFVSVGLYINKIVKFAAEFFFFS